MPSRSVNPANKINYLTIAISLYVTMLSCALFKHESSKGSQYKNRMMLHNLYLSFPSRGILTHTHDESESESETETLTPGCTDC